MFVFHSVRLSIVFHLLNHFLPKEAFGGGGMYPEGAGYKQRVILVQTKVL